MSKARTKTPLYAAARGFIEQHHPAELEYFDLLWEAAEPYLSPGTKQGTEFRIPASALGMGDRQHETDWVSPIVLMVIAATFAELPPQSVAPEDSQLRIVRGTVNRHAKRYRLPDFLTKNLRSFISDFYKGIALPLREYPPPQDVEESFEAFAYDSGVRFPMSRKEADRLIGTVSSSEWQEAPYELVLRLGIQPCCSMRGRFTKLNPDRAKLLASLLRSQGDFIDFADLIQRVWGKTRVRKNTLQQLKHRLCRELDKELDFPLAESLQTKWGAYRLNRELKYCVLYRTISTVTTKDVHR